MGKPRHVQVTGPLAPYVTGFEEDLAAQGYRSPHPHLYAMAQVSRWLDGEKLGAGDLSAASVERFLCWRKAAGYVSPLSPRRLSVVLGHLVGVGVTPAFAAALADTPLEVLMERYRRYLIEERGLSPASLRCYLDVARAFLLWSPAEGELGLQGLSSAAVSGFVLAECRRCKVGSAKSMTTRLRSLLRFLYLEGLTPTALAAAVPTVASWRQTSLPKALDAADVARLLESCDRRAALGRRDFAVLTLLSRLGLRAGEVAGLQLGDIAWRQGEVVVRGKAGRRDRLPLPADVGEALVAWLRRGRPQAGGQALFTRMRAPRRGLSAGGVSAIVQRSCRRAGLPPVGAHCLRHSAASGMLRAGASLAEVAQVLRHRSPETTSIYAKVDRRALIAVVRPWPGAVA
jgi:site-specific recombinase XerD